MEKETLSGVKIEKIMKKATKSKEIDEKIWER